MSENFNHINDELLVNYLLDEATAAEKAQVEQWIAADAGNRLYFEQFRRVWDESRKLAQGSTADENLAWRRFQTRIGTTRPAARPVRSMQWMRIAALFILIVGAALTAYLTLKPEPVTQLTASAGSSAIKDTLPDGSTITLNKNTVLTYPSSFEGSSRSVKLEGEAFFNITPDKEKPFLISVNDVTVKVVGTSFNVRGVNGNTEVIVETGIVQVTKNGKTVELRPGEKVLIGRQDTVLQKQKETDALYNYYRTREFICDNTPLWKLVEVLNEAYDANIVVENPALRAQQLNTTFSNESLDRILEVIALTLNLTVHKENGKIILR